MTAPIRPDDFDAVGFTKEARRQGYSADEIARTLEQRGHAQYAKEIRGAEAPTTRNFGLQAAEGALYGIGRPIAAAAGTAVQKLTGDDRPVGEIYRQLKDDVDNRSGVYATAYPGKAFAGQMAGAVLSAKANPMQLNAVGNATKMGRATNTSINAAANAGVASLANTDEKLTTLEGWTNALKDAGKSAGTAGAFGFAASPVLDVAARTAQVGSRLLPGPVRELPASVGRVVDYLRNSAADAIEGTADDATRALPRPTPALDQLRAVAKSPKAPGTAVAPTTTPTPPTKQPTPMLDRMRAMVPELRQRTAQAVRPAAPVDGGIAQIISRLQAQGMSLDDLERLSSEANGPMLLAELIGEKGVRDLTTMRLLGNKAPDAIRTTLDERAMDEAPQWQAALERLSGSSIRDARAFGEETIDAARTAAGPGYRATQSLPAPDAAAAVVVRDIQALADDGLNIWGKARLGDASFPKEPTDALTVGQLQRIRQVLDGEINYGGNPMNANSIERAAQGRLQSLRAQVDELAKSTGKAPFEDADAITAAGFKKAKAFEMGTKALNAKTAEELEQLAARSGDPDAFREGIASARQAQVQGMRDGGAGGIQNPYAPAMGSPQARAVTQAGLPNADAMAEAERIAQSGAERLTTRNRVLSGSPTTERAMDVMEQVAGPVNPGTVGQAVTNPLGLAARGISSLWTGAQRRMLGDEMDAASRYMLAGGPEQMSRDEALKLLRKMAPVLESQWAQQVMMRGRAAGDLGRASRERR